jgi:hypothetical protein
MNEKSNYGFDVRVNSHLKGFWSFGSCILHAFGETYLLINFAIWSISIGWLMKERNDEE